MSCSSKYSGNVSLMTCDCVLFVISQSVAIQSQTLKNMIDDNCADSIIPTPNVNSKIMRMIVEYLNRHAETPKSEERTFKEELQKFDLQFVEVEQSTLFDLIMAANYMEIKSLLDLTCQKVANMIKGKTPEEIRKIFNIKNDFTEEEENEIRKENAWAFD